MELKNRLNQVLKGFNLGAKCVSASANAHFGMWNIRLDPERSIKDIERRLREIALFLQCETLPILTVDYPNGLLRLSGVISKPAPIPLETLPQGALGLSCEGTAVEVDLRKHPHTLVAGTTGSGKSELLHCLIQNLIKDTSFKKSIYLVDPKRVEFNQYKKTDIIKGTASSYKDTLSFLKKMEDLVESTYIYLMKKNYRSINEDPSLDHQFIFIDEMSGLFLQDSNKELEKLIVKITQKSRAAGVHLVMATQRPSVDIFSPLIKANCPARICCKVSSRIDSQVVLDSPGAEHLLGKGDAIIKNQDYNLMRLQIGYIGSKTLVKPPIITCSVMN